MKPLRNGHLFIWKLLALLIPASIIIAWLYVPRKVTQALLQPQTTAPLPLILTKMENANYAVAVRSTNDTTTFQLEWVNKTVLEYPTATIYATEKETRDIIDAKLIGRIEARGNWYFPLDSTFKLPVNNHFILYDFIHQQVIDTINLRR